MIDAFYYLTFVLVVETTFPTIVCRFFLPKRSANETNWAKQDRSCSCLANTKPLFFRVNFFPVDAFTTHGAFARC